MHLFRADLCNRFDVCYVLPYNDAIQRDIASSYLKKF